MSRVMEPQFEFHFIIGPINPFQTNSEREKREASPLKAAGSDIKQLSGCVKSQGNSFKHTR